MKKLLILLMFLPGLSYTSEPAGVTIDSTFMLGKWQSEEYAAYGTNISSHTYIFTKTHQTVVGSPMKMAIQSYVVEGRIITVFGDINQKYIIIDKDTVSYEIPGVGTSKLHRL